MHTMCDSMRFYFSFFKDIIFIFIVRFCRPAWSEQWCMKIDGAMEQSAIVCCEIESVHVRYNGR